MRGEETHIEHTTHGSHLGCAHTQAPRNTLHKAESEAYETEVQLLLEVRGFRVLWESSSSDLEWVSLNKD